MNLSAENLRERLNFNRNFLVCFICLCLASKISGEFLEGFGSSDNTMDISAKNDDRVWIQRFPFNHSVSRNPDRHREKINLKNETKIVGGKDAEPHEFPHLLAVYFYNRKHRDFEFGCGASIINNNWALTAAHCLEAQIPSTVRVYAGKHDLYKKEDTQMVRNINQIIVHEDYSGPDDFENDIALLRFSKPIQYDDNITPIQLATRNRVTSGNVVVSGWGDTSEKGQVSQFLQKVQLPVVSIDECRDIYNVDNRQICAGYKEGGKDSCQGDSGGPLMQQARRGNNHILVGIVSYGKGCGQPNYPGVYTNVAKFRDWIDPKIVA